MWAVGIIASGNEVGLPLAGWQGLEEAERLAHRERAGAILRAAGAHFTIDTIADLLPVVDEINARLVAGEQP
ncbi:Phosphonoacetaldehyde hydrolase [compost metagenome]